MLKRKGILAVLVVLVLMVACAGTIKKDAYRALTVSKDVSYDATLSILGDLYKQKLITEAEKDQAIVYGGLYMTAHNEAVNALLAYAELGTEDNKNAYLVAITAASRSLAGFLEYIKPLLAKGGK